MGILGKLWKAVNPFRHIKKVLSWIMPQPDMPETQALTVSKQGSDHPIPVVYGTRQVGGIVVHKYVTDAAGGAANEFLHLVCVFCEGPVDAIEEIFFDGVSENDAKWTKDGKKWHKITRMIGDDDQNAILDTGIPNWTASHRLRGVAYAHIRLQMDADQTIWRGEPQIKARIRGRKIYDPRNGQTAYSENLPLQLLDYLTNTRFSKGFPLSRIKLQSFIDSANWADQTITVNATVNGVLQSVSQKRITGNLLIDTGQGVFANVKTMLSGMRGMMPIGSGYVSLATEREGSPVFFFGHNRSDKTNYAFITGPIKSKSGRKSERFNRVGVRFSNKALTYEMDEVFYPDATDPLYAQWLAEDNSIVLEQSFEMVTITNKAEAYQMAEVIAKRSRNRLECSFTASPLAILVEPGDIVGVTDDTRGWSEKPFRVEQIKIREDGDIDVELIEHQNAIYPWSGVSYNERTTGTNLGNPTQIPAPTNLAIAPDLTLATGGRLSWSSAANAFIRSYRVKVLSGTTLVWSDETRSLALDLPVLAPGAFTVTVSAVSTLGTLSPSASISYNLTAPVAPTSLDIVATNFELTVRPVLTGIGLGTEFEFALNDNALVRGRGVSMVFAGLAPNTQYTVFARTVNALGTSAWISQQVTTTAVATAVFELIKPAVESNFQPIFADLNGRVDNAVAAIEKQRVELGGQIGFEAIERQKLDKQLFNTMASAVQMRARFNGLTTELHDAVFEVDPATGQIRQRAYSYADGKFAQANVLIDGVAGSVTAAVQRITSTENRITAAESSLSLLPGQISQRATYAEVNAQIASALDAVLPVYSFGFFNSLEGWSAATGTMTAGVNQATATLGDIQNTALSFSGTDNPIITLNIQRTGGTGWKGDLIAVVDGVTRTYAGVIEAITGSSFVVRNLNLSGESTFKGTVTSIRLKLGLTTADTFVIKSITIGKPSAAYEQIAGLSAQVTQVGQDLSALSGTLTQYVTTAWYNDNAVKLSDVQTKIDSWNTTFGVTATLQQLSAADTIAKANSAKMWIDGANSTINNAVAAYINAPGGVNDSYNAVSQQLNAVTGSLSEQSVSISKLGLVGKNADKAAFWAEVNRKKMRDNLLDVGSSAAISERNIQTLASDTTAIAEEVRVFKASTATSIGQLNSSINQVSQAVTNESQARAAAISSLNSNISGTLNAQSQLIQEVKTTANGAADALAGLRTAVAGTNSQAQAELILSSTVDKANQAAARAYLGVTTSSEGGKSKITGIVVDGATRGLEFSGDTLIVTDTSGVKKFYWDSVSGTLVYVGKLVLTDGTAINNVADIQGKAGAGFYTVTLREGVFPTSNEATADFAAVVGRAPVRGDVLTYRNAAGSVSSAKEFNGTLWTAPTALIAGNLIATGSISGDRFMAGTEINAPIINGGQFRSIGETHMEFFGGVPFGPHNLIEWYGPKINGVNWNASTGQPILAGMLRSNAKTYKDASGGAFFGGTFVAGNISSSQTTTLLSTTASRDIEFTSNGGLITIAVSFSYYIYSYGPNTGNAASVICPVTPEFGIPSGVMFLERWTGTDWTILAQWPISGSRGCENGEHSGAEGMPNQAYRSWAVAESTQTYIDNSQVSGYRKLRARVSFNTAGYNTQSTQSLSIATSE